MPKDMKSKTKVVSAEEDDKISSAILGVYEGECADANITNLNGLDITREVWENVFNSDEYKNAIEHRWYLGFLGHPEGEAADCQDFRRACIVMTEGHIDDSGKVYGKFDLIDTPVGRIVKTFQDAGVTFGISVRGAGDIINNSVDPDTFVFRGFDLVTFPAFPESIPTFTAVAASTDAEQRKKYQKICASVKENMKDLDSVSSINTIQSCFAPQSDMYQELEERKTEILNEEVQPVTTVDTAPLAEPGSAELVCESEECETVDPRVDALTKLYLETKLQLDTLSTAHKGLEAMYDELVRDNARRVDSIERICTSQMKSLNSKIEADQQSYTNMVNRMNSRLSNRKKQLIEANTSLTSARASVSDLEEENDNLKKALRAATETISNLKSENLEYNMKIKANQDSIDQKDSIIASLRSKLNETVSQNAQAKNDASNRDETVEALKSKVEASSALIKEYQDAYSGLYAHALGVRLPQFRVTASTDVKSLQKMIRSSTSISVKPSILEPTQIIDAEDINLDDEDSDDLITL